MGLAPASQMEVLMSTRRSAVILMDPDDSPIVLYQHSDGDTWQDELAGRVSTSPHIGDPGYLVADLVDWDAPSAIGTTFEDITSGDPLLVIDSTTGQSRVVPYERQLAKVIVLSSGYVKAWMVGVGAWT